MSRGIRHLFLKETSARTLSNLRAQGADFDSRAALLEKASAHWLRHTAGSHTANGDVDLRYVRDNLMRKTPPLHDPTQLHHKLDWYYRDHAACSPLSSFAGFPLHAIFR
ncbi:hypothetical protein [Cupriavidus plantarum]|uniref:hypothetical protein n=1 Tax=Cupriavidus plantarum TaxID=942865 RepID=UPI001B195D1A|nr:hypothetical protein [Cupriavidus plantarum]CAG2139720.1 hypothetical protein LMG26296_02915 [Cupriavidus plantarum]